MLNFDEKTGFSVSEVENVRSQVAQDWIDAMKENGRPDLNVDPETPQGQIIDSEVAAIHQKDTELAFLANQFNPKTSSGIWQDALAKIYFLTRKPAINSQALCTVTGIQGTVIPAGSLIRSSFDESLWSLNEDITIGSDGTAQGTFTCQNDGAVEASANTLTQIVTTVANWATVNNPSAATVGSLEESQAAFEARRYQSVALNSRGTVNSVFARVAQVDNVLAVYAIDNKTNIPKVIDGYTLSPHSIYVAVLGGDDDDIAFAIYSSVSAGCDYNGNTSVTVTDSNTGAIEEVKFMRPDEYDIYIKVNILDDSSLPNNYENLIKQAVYNNFYGLDTTTTINGEALLRIIMNDDVYASRFLPSILNAGVSSLLSVQLSTDGTNYEDYIHIPIDASPTLTQANIIINLIESE